MKNKNIPIIILCICFVIWVVLAFCVTINRNEDWFETTEEVSSEQALETENIETDNKREYLYAPAWSKWGNNWVCTNIDGLAEIVLSEEFVEVSDFGNTGYAIATDENNKKCVIDRSGALRLSEYGHICENFITDSFQANSLIATKEIEVNGKIEIGYGVLNTNFDWQIAPSIENEYLKEFTKGIDGGVFTNEVGDKLYFSTIDNIIENVEEFITYNEYMAMYKKENDIYIIDKSGENEKVIIENVQSVGQWTEHTIFCELTDGSKVFKDIDGETILDVTDFNIINTPKFINNYAGIVIQTEEGEKYTVIDIEGNFQFELKVGTVCDTVAENYYRVSYFDEERNKEIFGIIDGEGNLVFEVNSSITDFSNGYALKDNKTYVRTDGTELILFKFK